MSKRVTAALLLGLPFGIAFLEGIHSLNSIYQDIGRHLRLGEIIWTTRQVPSTNLFSFTNPDFPFVNHHWLSEVALYLGNSGFGLTGLIIAKAVLLAVAFGLAYSAAWSPRVAATAGMVALASLTLLLERTDVRPEILSFGFLAWFLFVLYRRAGLVWTLPLVQLLWVNSHIYFFIGPFLWVAWLAGEWVRDRMLTVSRRRASIISALLAAATIANPHLIDGALFPFRVLHNYGYSIAENQSPSFMWAYGYTRLTTIALGLCIALTFAGFVLNWRRWRNNVFGAIACLATGALALMMIRNFPLFALTMLPATIRNFDECDFSLDALRWPVVAAIVVSGALLTTNKVYAWAHIDRTFGVIVPEGHQRSVEHFRLIGAKGPVFNNFDIGSFLIWKLPEERVFIDGRPEAYPAGFIRDTYIPMQQDPAVWARESARYGINAIIWNTADVTPWSRAFVERITADPQWSVAFFGDGVLILLRNTEENLRILERNPPLIIPR